MNSTDRSSADPWRFPAGTPRSAGSRGMTPKEAVRVVLSHPRQPSRCPRTWAIRGMGEKLSANLVAGTGSLSGKMDKGLAQKS
jgi:hypothetical protein